MDWKLLYLFFIFVAWVDCSPHRIVLHQKTQNALRDHKNEQGRIKLMSEKYYFYAPVSIGTPAQTLTIAFAINNADFWITSTKCIGHDLSCANHKKFNSSRSSTFQANGTRINLEYNDGGLSENFIGDLARDNVQIGSMVIRNQSLIESVTANAILYDHFSYDGVLGLAFPQVAVKGFSPVFQNMFNQKLISQPIFSLYLAGKGPNGSELIFGGSDSKYYKGDLTYVNVTGSGYWQVRVDHLSIGTSIYAKNFSVKFDTNLISIKGSIKEIYFLNKVLRAKPIPNSMSYEVNCTEVDGFPDIIFSIAGKNFAMSPRDFIYNYTYKEHVYCNSIFEGNLDIDPQEPVWKVGLPFLKKFYTLYDFVNKRMGLAEAV